MVKIKVLQNYKEYKQGTIYTINENEAHSLIDNGVAEIYHTTEIRYKNRMLRPLKKGKHERAVKY